VIAGARHAIKIKMSRIRPSKRLDDFIPSGSLRTGAADTDPAAPETPASRDKLIHPFSRQNTECVPWFASFCPRLRIPIQFGHLFRFNSAGHSGEFGHP
jgi:hypothetical protein